MDFVLLIGGFVLVIKGAAFLVDGACALAKKFSISELVIGLTVVAFGTSLPEFSVNVFASIEGKSSIAIGNILGSNIANILLILGVSGMIYPLVVKKGTVWKEIPLCLLAIVLLGILSNDKFIDNAGVSVLSRIDGLVLLSFFVIFIYYSFSIAKSIDGIEDLSDKKQVSTKKIITLIVSGLAALIIGGKLVVNGAVNIASAFGVSESIIGLTIVALGTSLPELATSAVAAYKRNSEIAIGNIVGSNIFNIFFILGVSSLIRPLPFESRNNFDIGIAVLASILLFVVMFTGKKHKLDRWEACLFLAIYVTYILFLIFTSSVCSNTCKYNLPLKLTEILT